MGVKGLWSLIGPAGKPISLDSLDGKVLAVDVSIWLNKAAKGMRDQQGRQVYNAHLVLMFHRICKLLFYGIKPIIVFDGGVPELKKETLRARQNRRLMAHARNKKVNEAMVQNFLQSKALEAVTGTKSTIKLKLPHGNKTDKDDLFELPEATNSQSESSGDEDCVLDEDWLESLHASKIKKMFDSPDDVDINSEEFNSLPNEIKHDLLVEVKLAQRRKGKRRKHDNSSTENARFDDFDVEHVMLPEEAANFSDYQLQHLQHRGHITQKINQLRKDMNDTMADELINSFGPGKFNPKTSIVEARKMMSDGSRRILFIKHGKKSTDANQLFDTDKLDDDYARFKQREQEGRQHCYMKLGREPAKFEVEKRESDRERFASDDSSGDETKYIEDSFVCKKQGKTVEVMNTTLSSDEDEEEWIEVKDAPEKIEVEDVTENIEIKDEDELIEIKDATDKSSVSGVEGTLNEIQSTIVDDSDGDDKDQDELIECKIKEKLNRIEELLRKKAQSANINSNGKRAREDSVSTSASDGNTSVCNAVDSTVKDDSEKANSRLLFGEDNDFSKNDHVTHVNVRNYAENNLNQYSSASTLMTEAVCIASDENADKEATSVTSSIVNLETVTVKQCDDTVLIANSPSPEQVETDRASGHASVLEATAVHDERAENSANRPIVMAEIDRASGHASVSEATAVHDDRVENSANRPIVMAEIDRASGHASVSKATAVHDERAENSVNEPIVMADHSENSSEAMLIVPDPLVSTSELAADQAVESLDVDFNAELTNNDTIDLASPDSCIDSISDSISNRNEIDEQSTEVDFVATPGDDYVESFTDSVSKKSLEDLQQMQTELDEEHAQLRSDNIKQTRQAASLTSDMYTDVQEMLKLFGVPFLVSPMEAEAQCAQLELMDLSNGSITDDGDVFLFGGKIVYKNIFNKDKYAELYDTKELESILHLNRKKLIALAFLTGSDYTLGLHGVGGVTAMEILHAFHNPDPVQTLAGFKTWLGSGKECDGMVHPISSLKSKLKDVEVPTSFNTTSVWDGYLKPEVDESDERFEWGLPDEVSIKQFAKEKFNWQPSHTSEILVPVIKRLTERRQAQKTIDRYFAPQPQLTATGVKSKRLQKILNAAGNLGDKELAMIGEELDPSTSNAKPKAKRSEQSVEGSTSKYFGGTPEFFDDPVTDLNKPKRKSPIKQRTPNKRLDLSTTTKSSSDKVQAQKVRNLMNAAAEGFKPLPPMVRMNIMNKAVNNRLKGKKVQPKKRGARQKAATALLNDANTIRTSDAPKPLVSSESDSD